MYLFEIITVVRVFSPGGWTSDQQPCIAELSPINLRVGHENTTTSTVTGSVSSFSNIKSIEQTGRLWAVVVPAVERPIKKIY